MSIEVARQQRRKRAAALGKVAAGTLPLREVLRDGRTSLGTCPVWRVLLTTPGMGSETVRKTLEAAHVWPLLAFGELSEAQRQRILDELPRRIR